MMKCCFDRRVWIGLGVLAVGLLVADPRAGWVALPVLAGLACPLSMLLMMRSMRRPAAAGDAERDRDAEIARLRREIQQLKASGGDMTRVPRRLRPRVRAARGAHPAGRADRLSAEDPPQADEPRRDGMHGHPPSAEAFDAALSASATEPVRPVGPAGDGISAVSSRPPSPARWLLRRTGQVGGARVIGKVETP
jgi:hypothetical protein